MRPNTINQQAGLLFVLLLAAFAIRAEETPLDAKNLMKSNGIDLDLKKREVRLEATVCLECGILEYLVCLPGTFEHESAFSAKCKPSLLHLMLLAIGLQPCAFDGDGGWEARASEQVQSRVCIEVEYEQNGEKVRRNVRDLLTNRLDKDKDGEAPSVWVFTGSYFGETEGKRVYAADLHGGIVGLGLDGASVLQTGKLTGNPYQGGELGLQINAKKIPAKGTKVQLVFSPFPDKPHQKAGR